jgi:hypothetical protein
MRLELPTHTIVYTDGVNYKIPIYWELWRNGQIIKSVFGVNGGMYNNIAHDNYNNHPDGSSIEAEVGFNYVYTFKFWHLGTINLPIFLIMFAGDSSNTNSREGMYNGDKAFSVQMGEYKQFEFILVNNPSGYAKINCNAGYIVADGTFTYSIPPPITLKDVIGGDDGIIIPKLAKRLRDNSLIEWYSLGTGVATGARIPNTKQIAGINNPFFIEPIVIPPPTNLFYNFNAADYFDTNNNPAIRSPIYFLQGGAGATVNYDNLIRDFSSPSIKISKKDNGYLLFEIRNGASTLIAFKNPLLSKAGIRIKGKMLSTPSEGLITIKSNTYESVEETTISNNLDRIIDYRTTATTSDIFVFIEQTNLIGYEVFEFECSLEFYCENVGEIAEPYLYREDANLYLGDEVVNVSLFETIVTTTNYADLNIIPSTLWQPTNIIQIPSSGVYHVYGRFTLENEEAKVFKIRSFTQS